MNRDDPLGRALRELDNDELTILARTYRILVVRAPTARQARFYLSIAAHLDVEHARRTELWGEVATALAQDEQAGVLVADVDDVIAEARRELREG